MRQTTCPHTNRFPIVLSVCMTFAAGCGKPGEPAAPTNESSAQAPASRVKTISEGTPLKLAFVTNNTSEFFRVALNPERGVSAKAAGELLKALREDWSVMEDQFTILSAGDEKNFDLRILLLTQSKMVNKVERLTAALVRYANLAYGS